ncbi:hypothetical protein GVN18_30075 [Pseudomonas sp. ODNR1LW]|nr:hypothetical protein [Pseudomonas sp. ODNR1LW]
MSQGYSSVAVFVLDELGGDVLRGYAAPSGFEPALIKLVAGDIPITFARAAGFSPAAEDAGVRLGWCGFELPGLRQAFAISDDVKVCCGVSGEILSTIPGDLVSKEIPPSVELSAHDLLLKVRSLDCCRTLDPLTPFALNHYRRHGARQFIEATYQTLLGRWPDDTVPDLELSLSSDEERVIFYLIDVIGSEEYAAKWGDLIPGPFSTGFRYDRTGMI